MAPKTLKSVKIFSLEMFRLYSTYNIPIKVGADITAFIFLCIGQVPSILLSVPSLKNQCPSIFLFFIGHQIVEQSQPAATSQLFILKDHFKLYGCIYYYTHLQCIPALFRLWIVINNKVPIHHLLVSTRPTAHIFAYIITHNN